MLALYVSENLRFACRHFCLPKNMLHVSLVSQLQKRDVCDDWLGLGITTWLGLEKSWILLKN